MVIVNVYNGLLYTSRSPYPLGPDFRVAFLIWYLHIELNLSVFSVLRIVLRNSGEEGLAWRCVTAVGK